VAQGDRPAVDVDLGGVQAEHVGAVRRLLWGLGRGDGWVGELRVRLGSARVCVKFAA
jgi:hypothetical protein